MDLRNAVSIVLVAGILAACGPEKITMERTSVEGTFATRVGDVIYTCSNYDGTKGAELAKRKNKLAALDEIDIYKEKLNDGRNSYPLSGQLCTTFYVD